MTRSGLQIRLSICIATLNRGGFIAETLETIVPQLTDETELVIVDGASSDNTGDVVAAFGERCPQLRYVRLPQASGVDRDYDIAVDQAEGDFVWLMTDDDLLHADAVARVMAVLDDTLELVIVDSEVRTVDFREKLNPALISGNENRVYGRDDADRLFIDTVNALSFIGCVVIRRDFWMARDRTAYYGSLFVHVGVIFQGATPRTLVIADPLVVIRYGNAMWTPRGFEIWMFKWPMLLWSFPLISAAAKRRITREEPWRQVRKLWLYRSIGGYGAAEYRMLLSRLPLSPLARMRCRFVAAVPRRVANFCSTLWCVLFARHARMNIYDLARSTHSTILSRRLARVVWD